MSQARPKRKDAPPLLLLVLGPAVLWGTAAVAGSGRSDAGCVRACERHVTDAATRARICQRCLVLGDVRAGWVAELAKQRPLPEDTLRSALSDPDWKVANAAAEALAGARRSAPELVWATRLVEAPEAVRPQVCLSAARFAAARGRTFSTWRRRLSERGGASGRRAFTLMARCEAQVRAALEVEIYGTERGPRLEALRHLAALTGRTPAHVVLEAMRSRPRSTDPIAAQALLLEAEEGGAPVGLALLEATTEENQERVNRLVAVYAEAIRKLAARRAEAEVGARRGVVRELGLYAPLSAPELRGLLTDEEVSIRLAAARAIARGEGRTLEEALEARLWPKAGGPGASQDEQILWLALRGQSGKPCEKGVVPALATGKGVPEPVRAAAIEAVGGCGGARAERIVLAALESRSEVIRASAVRALRALPRSRKAQAAARRALGDGASRVQAEAVRTLTALRQSGVTDELARLLDSPDATVRAEAARGLMVLGAKAHAAKLAGLLAGDPDRDVRIAAAEALGAAGGPQAAAALTRAVAEDPESRVRHVADQQLRALGFRR